MRQHFFPSLFFLSLLGNFVFAQKIDLDKRNASIEQVYLPQSNAFEKLKTYVVKFDFVSADRNALGLSEAYLKSQLKLEGLVYKTANPDLVLDVAIAKLTPLSDEVISNTKQEKNASGQMVSVTKYTGQVKFTATTVVKLFESNSSKVIEELTICHDGAPFEINSLPQDSKESAMSFISKAKEGKETMLTSIGYTNAFSGLMNGIKTKYTYRKNIAKELFWELDVKKAPEYADFNENLNKAIQVLEGLKTNSNLEEARTTLAPVLKYWTEKAAAVNTEEKKFKKLKYGYLINKAKTLYWLEMLDECQATAKEIVANEYDGSDGRVLESNSNAMKESLKKFEVKQWHVDRFSEESVESFSFAEEVTKQVAADKAKKEETIPVGYKEFPCTIIHVKKGSMSARVWTKNELKDASCFSSYFGAMLVYEENGSLKKVPINPDSIVEMDFGNRQLWESILFQNNLGMPVRKELFKVQGKNFKVKFLTFYDASDNLKRSLEHTKNLTALSEVLLNRNTGKMAAVGGWTNKIIRERTAEFYSPECPELGRKILADEFKDEKTLWDWHSQVAGYFNEICK